MPSQEKRAVGAIPAWQVLLPEEGITTATLQSIILTTIGDALAGERDRDDTLVISNNNLDYTIQADLRDVLVVVEMSALATSGDIILPAVTDTVVGQRVIVLVVDEGGSGTVGFAGSGGETIGGATDVTAYPATRVFYANGLGNTDDWLQVLAMDPEAAPVPVYDVARTLCLGNMDLSGTETEDGVSLSAGDLAFCLNQTTAHQNGLWVVAATAWTRPAGWAPQPQDQVRIREGNVFKDTVWGLTNDAAPTLGTDAQTWKRVDGRMVVLHATDANYTTPSNVGNVRVSFPNLTANRIMTMPKATGNDGQMVLVQIEANVAAARTVTFAATGVELINNNAVITGPWASALFVARNGNWNKMVL